MAESKSAQQVREITDKLEQGIKELFESERFKEYLRTMSKFYNYSFNNTLLIAMQKPEATLVAGYNSWMKNFDRHVRKDEKSIKILAPAPYKAKVEREKIDPTSQKPVLNEDGKPVTETVEVMRPAFKVVSVFDVSQTEGRELPDIVVDELSGSVEKYAAFFEALKQESPVPIAFEDIPGGAKGYYHLEDKRIAIKEGMSEIQTIKTAIHEIAHAKLHAVKPDQKTSPEEKKDSHTKEVEAESVAYTVCQRYGIETSDYSFGYIAGWSSGKETKELKGSLETIRSTAAEMIESIDAKLKVLLAEQEQVSTQAWDKAVALESEGIGFIEVHETDGGFDYSIYGADMKLVDGGCIDDAETTAYKAAMLLSEERGFEKPSIVFNYDAFLEQAAAANEVKPSFLDVPIYREMANYAYEAGELDAYRASSQANVACKEAIEDAISKHYGDNRLASEAAVASVLERFSPERVQFVLANTVQRKEWDGRFSQQSKQWASGIEVCTDNPERFSVEKAHPGLTDLFVKEFMRQYADIKQERDGSDAERNAEVAAWEKDEAVSIEKNAVDVKSPIAEKHDETAPPKHRLTADEKEIKAAVMDRLKGQIARNNDGMLASFRSSEHSFIVLRRHNVTIEGNTVLQNGDPLFAIHRRHSAKKTQGCYRELTPTLEYIKQEKKQEKPSIRDQLKAATKAQPERQSPVKAKKHDMGLE